MKKCNYCASYQKGYCAAKRAHINLTYKQMTQEADKCAAYMDVDDEPSEMYNRRYFGKDYE